MKDSDGIPAELEFTETLKTDGSFRLADDRLTAIAKMAAIEKIYQGLPHLDCGSCGAPSCHALAEDIIKGEAKEADCLIKLREHFKQEDFHS